jgi:hypothetical protein
MFPEKKPFYIANYVSFTTFRWFSRSTFTIIKDVVSEKFKQRNGMYQIDSILFRMNFAAKTSG